MKRFRFLIPLFIALALLVIVTGVTYAGPPAPQSVLSLTGPAESTAGDTITHTVLFDFKDNVTVTVEIIVPNGWSPGIVSPSTYGNTWEATSVVTKSSLCSSPPSGYTCSQFQAAVGTDGGDEVLFTDTTTLPADEYTVYFNHNYTTGFGGEEDIFVGDSIAHTVNAAPVAPTTIYASDQSDCGGYGDPGTSCFQSLQQAISATTATAKEVVIIGTLTADATGATIGSNHVTTIRGDSTPILNAASGCTAVITDAKGITFRDFTIDGTNCTGGTGIKSTASGGTTVDNMTVQDFSSGTGIEFSGSATGIVKNCKNSIDNNGIGVDIQSGTGTVTVGVAGEVGNNTFTGNTIGIKVSDANAVIKGNTISGGTTGIQLLVTPSTLPLGNSVTGASGYQIDCVSGNGAAFNYLGGVSTSSGSDCADTDHQLGAGIQGWAEASSYADVVLTGGASQAVFQLTDDPYTFGTGDGDLTAFYAVRTDGTPAVTHSGGMTQTKMLMDATHCSPMTNECWESAADGRSQEGEGYYAVGRVDPNAIIFANISATSNIWFSVGLVVSLSALALGALVILRKRRC